VFVLNQWYVVAWTSDVQRGALLARTVLGQPIVIYRTENGQLSVLRDRCAHRHAPLSLGRVESDGIRCMYHGLKYGGDGRCTEIPGQGSVPRSFRVESFPVIERDQLIWAWFGNAKAADAARIPTLPVHGHPDWRLITGYTYVQADYRLMVDNAMDLTHLAWCHIGTFGATGASTVRPELFRRKFGLKYVYDYRDSVLPEFHRRVTGWRGTADRIQAVDWDAPCTFQLSVQFTPTDSSDLKRGRSTPMFAASSHLFTPETETSTHYFWGAPLHTDFATDENLADWAKIVTRGFQSEDKPMIEAQQRNIKGQPFARMRATHYDEAVFYARSVLEKLAAT